ncbi:MAG: HAMP domain-containing histidine kinase [Deltaproteobacteria bacterium]|nr:HAMP domain-containing histidine kinase [Deltaproteobacteria bacterium]
MEDEGLDAEAKNTIAMIQESGNQLHQFVEKTSFLCTLKNTQVIEKSNERVVMQMKNVVASLGEALEEKQLEVNLDIDDALSLRGDWYMLYEVLTYLMHNAIKFSPENGEITIKQKQEADFAIFTISDQGPGIQNEWLNKIFDEFAIQDIMHHQKGQGLSLAIAKHVARLHNGYITAENNSDQGATFSLGLPLA